MICDDRTGTREDQEEGDDELSDVFPHIVAGESITNVRLLVITNDFPPTLGGIENIVYSLVSRWNPGEVVVLTRLVPGSEEFDRDLAFEVRREPVGTLLPTPDLAKQARRIVLERSIDMVYFPTPLPLGLLGPRLLRGYGVPYAVSIMGTDFILVTKIPGARAAAKAVLKRAEVVLPISRFLEDSVRRLFKQPPHTRLVPPGVDTSAFRPDVSPENLGDGPIVLFVSRLVARKGADVLVRASSEFGGRLVLVGGGPRRYVERLKRMAGELVLFAGPQPWERLPSFYAAAEVFAVPTRSRFGGLDIEGFGMVYLEAAAAGLPAVAGRNGGVEDAVVDQETGLIVDGNNSAAVAAAVRRLLDDPAEAQRMGARARERAVREFSWDVIASKFREALS